MPRPHVLVPLRDDLKSISSLLEEGLSQEQIAEYYRLHEMSIQVSQQTVSNKIRELRK